MPSVSVKGTIIKVWRNNEEGEEKPYARISVDGTYYSTFDKSLLDDIKEGEEILLTFHLEKNKFNTIDKIEKLSKETISKKVTREVTLSGIKSKANDAISSMTKIIDLIENEENRG